VENEIKIIASGYVELEALLTPSGWVDIQQGYLTADNRVRRITYENGEIDYFFTYKQRLPNGHNLEIEPAITQREFEEAWEYTQERLNKRRVSVEHDNLKWDVDFYRWSQPYFVVAEVEMPPDMQRPPTMLPCLKKHIVYEVPRNDGRFAARRLANEEFARQLAKDMGL
jgi:CYTH domain-containing protein